MSVLAAVLARQELQFLLEAAPAAKQFLSTEGVAQEAAGARRGSGRLSPSRRTQNRTGAKIGEDTDQEGSEI